MMYTFRNPDGTTVDIAFAFGKAPNIGQTTLLNGVEVVRIPSVVQVDAGHNRSQYPYISNSLPRNLAGCKKYGKNGQPVIQSKRHERNIMSEHGYEKD